MAAQNEEKSDKYVPSPSFGPRGGSGATYDPFEVDVNSMLGSLGPAGGSGGGVSFFFFEGGGGGGGGG